MTTAQTRILIIDDDANIRSTLALILRHNGYEVVSAATGSQALARAKSGPFELAFLDIRLPDISGTDLIIPLKEIQPDIAIIIVTAYASLETATKALNAGATAYLNKPVDVDQTLLTIQQVLEKRQLVVENRRLVREMRQELARRQRAEEKLERVNRVLLAIRRINQLIVQEDNRDRLLQQVCQLLAALPGYEGVWLGLAGQAQRPSAIIQCGTEEMLPQIAALSEKNQTPACWEMALAQPDKVMVEDTAHTCPGCLLAKQHNACMVTQLTHGNQVFGVLAAAVELEVFQDERQQALFQDVANDIGLALYTLEQVAAQRRTRRALRESEARFRSVVESATDAIVSVDANGRIVGWNQGATSMFGYTAVEIIGEPLTRLMPPLDKEDEDRLWAAFRHTAGTGQLDLRHKTYVGDGLHKDGRKIPLEASIATWQTGGRRYFTSIMRDLTERRRAEADLQRRNQELNRLYRASGAFLSEATSDVKTLARLIVTTVQREFEKANCGLILVEPGQDKLNRIAVTGPFAETVSQVQLKLSQPGIVTTAITSGRIHNVGDVQKYTDYLPGWPEARSEMVIPLKVGNQVIGAIDLQSNQRNAFNEDDERLLASFAERATLALMNARLFNELQRRATQLATLHDIELTISSSLESEQVYSAIVEQSAKLLDCQVANLVAWDAETQTGTGLASYGPSSEIIVGKEFPLEASGLAPELLATGKPIVVNDAASNKRIKPYWRQIFQIRAMLALPLVYRDDVLGFLFLIESRQARLWQPDEIDLAESLAAQTAVALQNTRLYQQIKQHAAELEQRVAQRTEELQRVNAQLLKAMRAKDAFLASMSHELRTPLNAIMLRGEIMQIQEGDNLSEKQKRSLAIIQESANHLLTLINDILDVAKIEAGKLSLTVDPVPVESLCQSSLRLIKEMASQKRIQVHSDIDKEAAVLWGDARRLKQVLVNLLSNAVKFTPEEGEIGLVVRGDAAGDKICFTVWDTGIGIAPEDMPALFRPFSQIDNSLARKYEGSGLGLALAHRLVTLHNGSISVASEVGKGSRFTVSLPWPPAQRSRKLPETAGTGPLDNAGEETAVPPAPTHTILLAEDNKVAADTLTDYLRFKGYNVIVAYDGLDAVNQAREKKPALILMDIQMPGMDGLEAIRRIRSDATLDNTPIIALTALAMPGDKERCLAAGATAYYSKPYSLRQLTAVIETALDNREKK